MLILIPAAGASSRMRGSDKLLAEVDRQPLLARQVSTALATGAGVAVTLPPDNAARRAAVAQITDVRLTLITVPDAAEGMATSIRAGAEYADASGADALMILLADMPDIQSDDLTRMIEAFDGQSVIRAVDADGRAGHPVIFPARLFAALAALIGDEGARAVLSGEPVVNIPLPGQRATTDLDTPEDWDAWRKATRR